MEIEDGAIGSEREMEMREAVRQRLRGERQWKKDEDERGRVRDRERRFLRVSELCYKEWQWEGNVLCVIREREMET